MKFIIDLIPQMQICIGSFLDVHSQEEWRTLSKQYAALFCHLPLLATCFHCSQIVTLTERRLEVLKLKTQQQVRQYEVNLVRTQIAASLISDFHSIRYYDEPVLHICDCKIPFQDATQHQHVHQQWCESWCQLLHSMTLLQTDQTHWDSQIHQAFQFVSYMSSKFTICIRNDRYVIYIKQKNAVCIQDNKVIWILKNGSIYALGTDRIQSNDWSLICIRV